MPNSTSTFDASLAQASCAGPATHMNQDTNSKPHCIPVAVLPHLPSIEGGAPQPRSPDRVAPVRHRPPCQAPLCQRRWLATGIAAIAAGNRQQCRLRIHRSATATKTHGDCAVVLASFFGSARAKRLQPDWTTATAATTKKPPPLSNFQFPTTTTSISNLLPNTAPGHLAKKGLLAQANAAAWLVGGSVGGWVTRLVGGLGD